MPVIELAFNRSLLNEVIIFNYFLNWFLHKWFMNGFLPPRIDENGWESLVFYQIWRKLSLVEQCVPVKTIGRRKSWTLEFFKYQAFKKCTRVRRKEPPAPGFPYVQIVFHPILHLTWIYILSLPQWIKKTQNATILHFILMCHLTKNKWSVPGLAFAITIEI